MKDATHDNLMGGTLQNAIMGYTSCGTTPFHMPGHKRNATYNHLMGVEKLDLTEIDGLDDLHAPKGILFEAQKRAEEVFSVPHCRFLVNGSTVGILAGVKAATRRGEKVLIARNCHRSVYNAVELCGLDVSYIFPQCPGGLYGCVSPDDVERALSADGGIKLVVLTSPTYEGVISDIKSIAEVCHCHGAVLMVDEAHGAHLGLCGAFCKSARQLGADIVVNSLHKTLPSLTQTALLHVTSDRVDISRVDEALAVFETSSPSYVLMCSIDGAVNYIAEHGKEELKRWHDEVVSLRGRLSELFDGDSDIKLFEGAGAYAIDVTKLCLLCPDGYALARALRAQGIEVEMSAPSHVLALSGMGDTAQTFDRLYEALKAVKSQYRCAKLPYSVPFFGAPRRVCAAYEVDALEQEQLPLNSCDGRISAENVWVYPPGSPVIVKGERVDGDTLNGLVALDKCGAAVQSSRGDMPKALYVLRELRGHA